MAFNETFKDIQSSYSKYILTPAVNFGFAGFVFDIDGETAMQLQADITDHYTEDNYAIQDHIAIKPLKVTLKNYVGELSNKPSSIVNNAKKVTQKLTTIAGYLPKLETGASQAKSLLTESKNLDFNTNLNNATDLYSLVKNINPFATKQQQAYQYFKSLWENKILINLQTPYEFIQNMAIESIAAIQAEDSVSISNFNITLKQMRFAQTQSQPIGIIDATLKQGKNALQSSTGKNIRAKGVPASTGLVTG